MLCFHYPSSSVFVCCPACGLVYPVVMGRSFCCAVCVCGPVCALVNLIVMGCSRCVVLVCDVEYLKLLLKRGRIFC
jgi:hypothetical protein